MEITSNKCKALGMLLSSIPMLDHKHASLKKPEHRDRNEKLYMVKIKLIITQVCLAVLSPAPI